MILTKAILDALQELMVPEDGVPVAPNLIGERIYGVVYDSVDRSKWADTSDPQIERWQRRIAETCEALANELVDMPPDKDPGYM